MVLKIFGKYWYIVNKWRHPFASTLKVKVENITIHFTQIFNFWRSVISLIPGNRFHWISKYKWEKSNEIFFEKYFGQNIFQWQLLAEAGIRRCFLWKLFWKFHKFPRKTFPVSPNLQFCLKEQFHRDVFLGNLRSFLNSYYQKLHILLSFFITYFANFIYSSPNLQN